MRTLFQHLLRIRRKSPYLAIGISLAMVTMLTYCAVITAQILFYDKLLAYLDKTSTAAPPKCYPNCSGAELQQVNLIKANLQDVNFSGANLSEANLNGANLNGANLTETNLSKANLRSSNLSDANLYRANLSGANLYGVNLTKANLEGTDLSDANLSMANLTGATYDKDTIWPESIREMILEGQEN